MTLGVVVMAYGTPASFEEVEAFYTDVRRGRPPSPEQLADLERRYAAIGGVSPLAERTAAQVAALQRGLDEIAPGRFRTYYGSKHAHPRIEDAVGAAIADGSSGLVGLVLAPHYSRLSVGEYLERASECASAAGVAFAAIEHWHDDPVLIELLAERVEAGLEGLGRSADETEVLFSAHSLPARILETGDPYPSQLAETAALVASRCALAHWRTAWQSAGRTSEPWLGPDVLAVIDELAAHGTGAILVAPVGFTSDHLEVCYDLDIEASQRAAARNVSFARTASLNDEPRLFAALARRVAAMGKDLG